MTQKKPVTYDHLKSKKKPTVRSVRISLDDDVQEELDVAERELDDLKDLAKAVSDPSITQRLDQAEERVKHARKAAIDSSVLFRFRSIGRRKYDELVDLHPPTTEQKKEVEEHGGDPENLAWDPDIFPKELVKASIIEPDLAPDQIEEMWNSDDWSTQELSALSICALEANNTRRVLDLGKG